MWKRENRMRNKREFGKKSSGRMVLTYVRVAQHMPGIHQSYRLLQSQWEVYVYVELSFTLSSGGDGDGDSREAPRVSEIGFLAPQLGDSILFGLSIRVKSEIVELADELVYLDHLFKLFWQ